MGESLLVLLVEDDPSDERLALRAFAKSNVKCKVDVVRDGVEAVEYLTAPRTENPHLILLDLKLPKKNGHEVLKWIRSNDRTKRIPVVCFTSSSEQADVMGCFESGANSFVRKAVDYHDYMARFAKLAEYWLSINEPC